MMSERKTRVRGLVRAMRYVQDRLALGVTRDEASRLELYVRDVLSAMERIFHEHRSAPSSLPRPSREAYHFFCRVQKNGITATGRQTPSHPQKTSETTSNLRVPGIVAAQRGVLDDVSIQLESTRPGDVIAIIAPRIAAEVDRIETACDGHGGTPADLAGPSRRAYSVLAFLNDTAVLERYVEATATAKHHVALLADARASARRVRIDELGGIYRYRLRGSDCFFRLNPGFLAVESAAIELAVRDALLQPDDRVRKALHEYCHDEAFCGVVQEIEDLAAPPASTRGLVYDLAELCDVVRLRDFRGELGAPAVLAWSEQRTYHTFGYYSSLRDRITISRSLDNARVPKYAIEFVMYHELLHKKHGIGFATSRRTIHTSAFRDEERRFPRYDDARAFLRGWAVHVKKRRR